MKKLWLYHFIATQISLVAEPVLFRQYFVIVRQIAKLPGIALGNLGSLGSNKEIPPQMGWVVT